MSESNVRVLFKDGEEIDDQGPVRTRGRKGYCRHERVELDLTARRVYCRACEEEVDTFEAFLRFARDFEFYMARRKDAHRAARREEERLEDLQRRVRNAKAQLRRAER